MLRGFSLMQYISSSAWKGAGELYMCIESQELHVLRSRIGRCFYTTLGTWHGGGPGIPDYVQYLYGDRLAGRPFPARVVSCHVPWKSC